MHTGGYYSSLTCQQSAISDQSYHSGIMDGRHQGKVYRLLHALRSLYFFFFALLLLGACLQACFLFFLTVSDSPISELQALQEHTC